MEVGELGLSSEFWAAASAWESWRKLWLIGA